MVTDTKIQMIYIYTFPKLQVKNLPNKRMAEPNAEALSVFCLWQPTLTSSHLSKKK